MASKMNLDPSTAVPNMDRFAVAEESKYVAGGLGYTRSTYNSIPDLPATAGNMPTLQAKQFGELAMAYVDCDTIPFMWRWAHNFALFDNIFQTTVGPSTPNAIAMIAGQSGETQWVKHPDLAITFTNSGDAGSFTSTGVPVVNDPIPGLPGASSLYSGIPSNPTNTTPIMNNIEPPPAPQRKNEGGAPSNVAPSLTFASLPLSFTGSNAATLKANDTNPAQDLGDIKLDILALTYQARKSINWGWYQNGYSASEPNLPTANAINTVPHASYIGHHNGAQYFGYVVNNPQQAAHLHGLGNFFDDMASNGLPKDGGVFYVRGGYDNIAGLAPAYDDGSPDANYVQANFLGDDDHPAYSDSEISEALLAREINAIASSPYWGESAIVITYDESEGDYDHVPPRILSFDPAGLPLSRGPRIPLIVISPYARAGVVAHEEGDHASVISLINNVFGLTSLAELPDELLARASAAVNPAFNRPDGKPQTNLGPHDALTPGTGSLLSAFDPARLAGRSAPLPASLATIPDEVVNSLPHYNGQGCKALGITAEDRRLGIPNAIPADFSPRPSQTTN
jgi:phospholipase C